MIVFSIPVHASAEVIFDQIENFRKFAPNAGIVIHPAKQLIDECPGLPSQLMGMDRVWINDDPLYTGSGMVLKCHISNFHFATRMGLEFSHFSLNASNELFVKSGVEEYINRNNFGFNKYSLNEEGFGFSHWRDDFFNDGTYLAIMSDRGKSVTRYVSQVEGTFYPKEAFELFAESYFRHAWREVPWPVGYVHGRSRKLVELFQRLQSNKTRRKYIGRFFYTREEFYPPNYFSSMCHHPARPYCFMNWKNSLKVLEEDIESIRAHESEISPDASLFSVKRVPLDLHDPLRKYIRNLPS